MENIAAILKYNILPQQIVEICVNINYPKLWFHYLKGDNLSHNCDSQNILL